MPRRAIALLLALLLSGLAGCGAREPAEGWTALAMASETAGALAGEMTALAPELYERQLSGYYKLDEGTVLDGAILAGTESAALETAVFRFTDEAAAREAAARLEEYRRLRARDFYGYMPEEAAMVEQALTVRRGEWCALIILPSPDEARERFEACFDRAPPEEYSGPTPFVPQPGAERGGWVYDEQRLLEAYAAGDWSGLGEFDRAILDEAARVLSEAAPEGMSLYARELAIHDYMMEAMDYDSGALSILPGHAGPENRNPYGALIEGRAVCGGYASTFQLFMKLIGVECLTVEGEESLAHQEHAWNMVKLEGEWYCVDVTWDDPDTPFDTDSARTHQFFNVTSAYMRDTYHDWDADGVPEASGTKYAWAPGKENA